LISIAQAVRANANRSLKIPSWSLLPNRFLALYGAGKAAEAAKQPARAKGYYRQIVTICKAAAPDRPELVYARKMAK
jgi:hypothetical protein